MIIGTGTVIMSVSNGLYGPVVSLRKEVMKSAKLIAKNLLFALAQNGPDAEGRPNSLVCNDVIKLLLDMDDSDVAKAWGAITQQMKASTDDELEKSVGTAYKPLLAALLRAETIVGSGRFILDRLHDTSFEKAKEIVMAKDVAEAYKELFNLLAVVQKVSSTSSVSSSEQMLLDRVDQTILSVKIVLACQSGVVGTTESHTAWSLQSCSMIDCDRLALIR